jgi:monovalent cation/proton antiporter MnhG/PhaG subunit
MTARAMVEVALLAIVVLACWLGVIGMWRMRDPTQALHYLSLPSSVGAFVLTVAIFVEVGPDQAAWKMLFLAAVLFATNAIVTHATARAFRSRELGHWEPKDGDPMEFLRPSRDLKVTS